MHSSDSEQSSDDSGAGDDPNQSRAVPNSLLQLYCDYASGKDYVVPAISEKEFDEQGGVLDCSEFTRQLSLPSAGAFPPSVQLK